MNLIKWLISLITGIIAILIGILTIPIQYRTWATYKLQKSHLSLLEFCIKMAHLLKNFCPYCGSETYEVKHIKTGDIAYYQCSICKRNFY